MFIYSSATENVLVYLTLVLFIIFWIRWRKKKLKIFEELQIPGPPPHFIFGNIREINERGLLQCQEEWIKKYGPIVGYYHGLKPILMITDQNALKRIFIKDFHLFSERPDVVPLRVHSILDYVIPASQIMDSLILNQKGENWKRKRSKLSPVFSGNKLKMMIPFVDKISEVTLTILEERALQNKVTDIYKLLQFLTLDVICAQAFAINTDAQRERDENPLFRSAKTIFDNPLNSKILTFGLCFPEVSVLGMALNFLKMFFSNGFSIPPLKITNVVGKVIEERRNHPELQYTDILQSLVDAAESEMEELKISKGFKDEKSGCNNINKKTPTSNARRMAEVEIKANALVVFLAGYETTSSALAYTIYMLAKYPSYQVEIHKEIDQNLGDNELDYNILNNLQLLERFMMESMRFYSPGVNFVLRIATEDVDFGYFRIPKGMTITVPVSYMHFNESSWENPKTFDPDRFLLEKRSLNSMNYWVFGNGPRNCLGKRLANITSKVILTKMLQRFTFEFPKHPKESTISLKVKCGTMVPDKVLIKVKKRNCYQKRKKDET